MKLKITTYLLVALMAGFAASCVRDEIPDCPPLRVQIAVKDKNYFNVDKVELEDRMSEDLAFREYVPTLYWVLRDLATGEVVEEEWVHKVEGDGKTVPVEFCPCVPHGTYVLTVWGGLDDEEPLGDDPLTIDFHPSNTEGRDIYMTNDTILYDAWHNDQIVEMERTKGKLIIEKVNLPKEITSSEKKIDGIFSTVNNAFGYSGNTHVLVSTPIESQANIVTKTMLTPSVNENGSMLSMRFFDVAGALIPTMLPKAVDITMKRNELTVLRYEWDRVKQEFNIYILVNDNWQLISNMSVE